MTECRLQLIEKYPFDVQKQNNIMSLNYTCFTDNRSSKLLQIQVHGFRYIKNQYRCSLIMIIIDDSLVNDSNEIILRVPMTIYKWFNQSLNTIKIWRQVIQLQQQILPKLQVINEINIYFNEYFRVDKYLIKLISSFNFICQNGDYYIDCNWLLQYINRLVSFRQKLYWLQQFNKQKYNYKSYLRFYIEFNNKKQTKIFKRGQTKIIIKKNRLHNNQLYKIILLNNIENIIFNIYPYYQFQNQLINLSINNQIIILQTQKDISLERYIQYYTQLDYKIDFQLVDCQFISSTSQFWNIFENIFSLDKAIIYLKNINWIEELYLSQQILNFQIKHVIQKIQKIFKQQSIKKIKKHCLIIQQLGQISFSQFLQNVKEMIFKIDKNDKKIIFNKIFNEFDSQHLIKQQIINQFYDKFGWQIFLSFMKNNWNQIKNYQKNLIFKKIKQLIKQQQVQNLIQVSWDDVGGLETAKQQIIQTVLLPIKHPQIFDQWIKPRTGLLFYGPPGTGKTLLGKCVAKQCKMNFISVKGPQLLNMYVGESQKNVRQVFQRARSCSPCIVFMDQLDALIPKRGNSGDSNQVMDRIVAQLLQQMDTASSHQVFIIGATNRPDLLDPSILRPGRFDKQIYLGITQSKEDRIKIIKAQTRHLCLQQNLNWDQILNKVPKNFTGADFYGLTSKAVMAAAQRTINQYEEGIQKQKIVLSQQDFLGAIPGIKPSVTEADLQRYENLKKIYS